LYTYFPTVGRYSTCPDAALMVLVTRSGMEHRRLAPTSLSFRNPDTRLGQASGEGQTGKEGFEKTRAEEK
jgi:hypothetical protein